MRLTEIILCRFEPLSRQYEIQLQGFDADKHSNKFQLLCKIKLAAVFRSAMFNTIIFRQNGF